MKKAKIMLLSLTLFATFGGILAFKAKTFNLSYCTKTFIVGGPSVTTCDNTTTARNSMEIFGTPNVYATSLDKGGNPITTSLQCTEMECPAVRLVFD
jgi:hypothetical protein